MVYARAAEFSSAQPCTNVPIPCTLCIDALTDTPLAPTPTVPTIWKYNLLHHLDEHHVEIDGAHAHLDPQMIVSSYISRSEELAFGIPESKTLEARDMLGVPAQSDGPEMEELKRARSDSTPLPGRPPKKGKKD